MSLHACVPRSCLGGMQHLPRAFTQCFACHVMASSLRCCTPFCPSPSVSLCALCIPTYLFVATAHMHTYVSGACLQPLRAGGRGPGHQGLGRGHPGRPGEWPARSGGTCPRVVDAAPERTLLCKHGCGAATRTRSSLASRAASESTNGKPQAATPRLLVECAAVHIWVVRAWCVRSIDVCFPPA